MEDAPIEDLYLARDEGAIEQTAQKYGMRLRGIANRILSNLATAEECENDTYLEAWNRVPPNEPRSYLFAFLGKITRHLAIDRCRREERQKRAALYCELTDEMEQCLPGRDNVAEAVEARQLSQAIDDFLRSCPGEQRDMFVRRYWYFDTISEISQRFHCSQSRVKTTLFRLREKLRQHLEQEGYRL